MSKVAPSVLVFLATYIVAKSAGYMTLGFSTKKACTQNGATGGPNNGAVRAFRAAVGAGSMALGLVVFLAVFMQLYSTLGWTTTAAIAVVLAAISAKILYAIVVGGVFLGAVGTASVDKSSTLQPELKAQKAYMFHRFDLSASDDSSDRIARLCMTVQMKRFGWLVTLASLVLALGAAYLSFYFS